MAALGHGRAARCKRPPPPLPPFPPGEGEHGYLFSTKDAKREEARLRKIGVKITKPVKKEEWGTIFWFSDLDGNEFPVIEED